MQGMTIVLNVINAKKRFYKMQLFGRLWHIFSGLMIILSKLPFLNHLELCPGGGKGETGWWWQPAKSKNIPVFTFSPYGVAKGLDEWTRGGIGGSVRGVGGTRYLPFLR